MKTLRKDRSYIDSNEANFKLDQRPSTYSTALEENAILRDYLEKTVKLSPETIQRLLEQSREILLPLSIFSNDLSTLEVIVHYLHDSQQLSFVDIAALLHRDERTIWHAHHRALKKRIQIKIEVSTVTIPISIFANRTYAPLEALVGFLKESGKLSFAQIAIQLHLSSKTVWTEYHRYQKKQHGR